VIALDTNILARYYVEDEADSESKRQRALARAVLGSDGRFFVPLTVVQELEWVMRGAYGFEREKVADVFDHLLGLPNVEVDAATVVRSATGWHRQGMDFSDALHVALSPACSELATFDRTLAKRTRRLGLKPSATTLTA
jgi:predicted nucleic-acid-binding protein